MNEAEGSAKKLYCQFMKPPQTRPCAEVHPVEHMEWCGACLLEKYEPQRFAEAIRKFGPIPDPLPLSRSEGWQPIALAPKGFVWVMGYGPECGVAPFVCLDDEWLTPAVDQDNCEMRMVNFWKPTHFMKLPSPPAGVTRP